MLFVPCYCLNQGTVQFTLNIGAASEVSQKVEHMLQSWPTEQIKRFKKKISTLMQCNQDQLDHWVMSKHAPVHLVEDTIHQFVWRNQCGKLLLSPSPGVSVNWEARKLGAEMKRGKLCGEHIWRPRGFLLYRKDRGGLVGQLCKTLHESCKWKVKRAAKCQVCLIQPKANLCHVSSKKSHFSCWREYNHFHNYNTV